MSVKGEEKTGTVFAFTLIVNIAEVEVTRSERVPITLMVYVPTGFEEETNIAPVAELTLMRSIVSTSECPLELSRPEYDHVKAYVPQLAEKGVIGKFESDPPYSTEKIDYD
jgi:hypothetical protein